MCERYRSSFKVHQLDRDKASDWPQVYVCVYMWWGIWSPWGHLCECSSITWSESWVGPQSLGISWVFLRGGICQGHRGIHWRRIFKTVVHVYFNFWWVLTTTVPHAVGGAHVDLNLAAHTMLRAFEKESMESNWLRRINKHIMRKRIWLKRNDASRTRFFRPLFALL